jgi:hypothetical protein
MSKGSRERRAAGGGHPANGSAGEFVERGRDHRYAQLLEGWNACSECGGLTLLSAGPEHLRRIPETAGVCATCGAAFTSGPDGRLRLLVPRSRRPAQDAPMASTKQAATAKRRKSPPATTLGRNPRRRGSKPAGEGHEVSPGVQGANVGYWQAVGGTRSGAKRSKRP